MSTQKITPKFATQVSPDQLRQTFETAIAKTLVTGPSRSAQRPIAVRKGAPVCSDEAADKRSLTDAARALAQLWNISPNLIR